MNRFIRFEYNDKKLRHIDDCKDESILSIDLALQSVLSIVDRLDHYIEDAKRSRHYPSDHGLTEDESVAIYLYANDWNDQSLNKVLNNTLQSEDHTALQSWLSFLKLFNAALEKLSTVHNTVWRGLTIDAAEKLNENEDLILCSVISCSSSRTIIEHLLDDKSVLCSIKSFSAKNIQGYTSKNEEDEVILLPGTRLRVKCKQLNNDLDKPIIYLEEINEVEDDHEVINKVKMHDMNNPLDQEDTIEGPNADQKANGEGICVFETGNRFIGAYKNGNRYGHGILLRENGIIEACDWIDDVQIGQSLKIQSTRGLYEWKDAMGKERWYRAYDDEHGNRYIGNIAYDKAHGLGIRFWPNNTRYEGNFMDDKKHGYGIYFYTDRDRYMGEWYNDETNGKGLLIWSNGTYYQGEFTNGKKHGYGKVIFADGQIQEGEWRSDEDVA
ncbi:unnamed protein product [Rotaria sp. Silwood2]|nr:unnamed protein product [Rotaria sp. Silwood2]